MHSIDILLFSEASSSSDCDESTPTAFKVPTLETVSEVCPEYLQPDGLHVVSQVQLTDPIQLLAIVPQVLCLLMSPTAIGTRSYNRKHSQLDYSWVIDCLLRSWGILGFQESSSLSKAMEADCHVFLLAAVRASLSRTFKSKHEFGTTSKAVLLLCQSVGSLLPLTSTHLTPSLEIALCWAMLDLLSYSRESEVVLEAFSANLIPLIAETIKDCNRFEGYSVNLQVVGIVSHFCFLLTRL